MTGLRQRIEAARKRQQIRASFERVDQRRALAQTLRTDKDGGLLIHVAIEKAGA